VDLQACHLGTSARRTAYFIGALGAHLRVGDTRDLVMPLPPVSVSKVCCGQG
jgi:hypothetical protein